MKDQEIEVNKIRWSEVAYVIKQEMADNRKLWEIRIHGVDPYDWIMEGS